ncbi:MAG: hypothetical protein F4Z29_10925 [Gemmatimonadetes bacterium]|nr:hypothetical protein [Gemmatimonadota bacterium]
MPDHTILVVVDDLFFSAKIGETIRQLGGMPRFAAEASEIPVESEDGPPAAIIVDLDLSRTDAVGLISHLKAGEATRDVPMMAYGRHTRPEAFVRAREAGCERAVPRSEFVKRLPEFVEACRQKARTAR